VPWPQCLDNGLNLKLYLLCESFGVSMIVKLTDAHRERSQQSLMKDSTRRKNRQRTVAIARAFFTIIEDIINQERKKRIYTPFGAKGGRNNKPAATSPALKV